MSHREEENSTLAAPAVTQNGGRVELRQTDGDDSGAVYRARFFLGRADAELPIHGTFRVSKAGEVTFSPEAEAPPGWLVQFSLALLRTTARSSDQRGWPRRITRWRNAPKGSAPTGGAPTGSAPTGSAPTGGSPREDG